jgi:DNA excision repair protein ERCC-4
MQQETVIQQFAQRIAVRIAVDDRERSSGVALALWQRPGINIAIRRLKLGDYQVDDTLLVERKTLADFALSVRDCRLFTQVGRLTRQRKMRTCLILEGTPERYPRLAISLPAFQGALITVTLVFGLPVLYSATPEETADLILYAANQLQRREVRPPRRRGFKVAGNRRRQILMLQAIPEIGPKKAELLLDAFGSPAGVANVAVGALEAVDGIGPKAAREIYRVFNGGPIDR